MPVLYYANVYIMLQLETTPPHTARTALSGHGRDRRSNIGTVPAKTGRLATMVCVCVCVCVCECVCVCAAYYVKFNVKLNVVNGGRSRCLVIHVCSPLPL